MNILMVMLLFFGLLAIVMPAIILFIPALIVGWAMTLLKSKNYHRNTTHTKSDKNNTRCPVPTSSGVQVFCPKPRPENVDKWCINLPNSSLFSDLSTFSAYLLIGNWYVNPIFRAIIRGGFGH